MNNYLRFYTVGMNGSENIIDFSNSNRVRMYDNLNTASMQYYNLCGEEIYDHVYLMVSFGNQIDKYPQLDPNKEEFPLLILAEHYFGHFVPSNLLGIRNDSLMIKSNTITEIFDNNIAAIESYQALLADNYNCKLVIKYNTLSGNDVIHHTVVIDSGDKYKSIHPISDKVKINKEAIDDMINIFINNNDCLWKEAIS